MIIFHYNIIISNKLLTVCTKLNFVFCVLFAVENDKAIKRKSAPLVHWRTNENMAIIITGNRTRCAVKVKEGNLFTCHGALKRKIHLLF